MSNAVLTVPTHTPNCNVCCMVSFLLVYMLFIHSSPGDRVFLEGKGCVDVIFESLGPKFSLEYTQQPIFVE